VPASRELNNSPVMVHTVGEDEAVILSPRVRHGGAVAVDAAEALLLVLVEGCTQE